MWNCTVEVNFNFGYWKMPGGIYKNVSGEIAVVKQMLNVCWSSYSISLTIFIFCKFWAYQVSYGSELSNRGPTFDMDLSDFLDGEQPMSYAKAKNYFAQDPSQRYRCVLQLCGMGVAFLNTNMIPVLDGLHMLQGQFWFWWKNWAFALRTVLACWYFSLV